MRNPNSFLQGPPQFNMAAANNLLLLLLFLKVTLITGVEVSLGVGAKAAPGEGSPQEKGSCRAMSQLQSHNTLGSTLWLTKHRK